MAMTPYNRALGLLTARAYSAKDLRRKLVQHGASADEVDDVMQRLQDAGLIDDVKYALAYTRSKLLGAGVSTRRIKQELAQKGIPAAVAGDAIDQVVADEEIDTDVVIDRVARKKLAALGDLEPLVLRRRLYAFLAGRGYELDEVQAAVQRLFSRR